MTKPKLDEKRAGRAGWADYGLAVFSGVVTASAFPDFGLWPLAWVGLVPLVFAVRGRSVIAGAFIGITAGFVFFSMTLYWVSYTMIDYADIPAWMAIAINGLMALTLALYFGLFGYATAWISREISSDAAIAAAPFVWVSVEFLRSNLGFLAFPWARIADSQYTALPIIQVADLVGEEGLGFLIVLGNVCVVRLIDWGVNKRRGGSRPFPRATVVVTLALVFASLVYGQARLASFSSSAREGEVPVAIIQGNIDQKRKWDKSYTDEQMDIYLSRSMRAVEEGARLIVWPETAASFYFGAGTARDAEIFNLSKTTGVPMIFGAMGFSKADNDSYEFYNRAWLVRPDGLAQKYDKARLVPFGEYVPMRNLLFFVEKMVAVIGEIKPGAGVTLLNVGDYMAGPQICFEIIFPRYSRIIARRGGSVIVNITNDSWYGRTPASRQSLAMGVFRAVENRLPLLRAAQSGVSAIVSPTGEITGETKLFTETTLMGRFTPRTGPPTLYTRSGDLFSWLCVAALLTIIASALARRRP